MIDDAADTHNIDQDDPGGESQIPTLGQRNGQRSPLTELWEQ